MISTLIAAAVIFLLVAADQMTKLLVSSNFELGESVHIIKGVLDFTYVQNRGAAFGMFADKRWIFLIATILLLAAMIFAWYKNLFTNFIGKSAAVLVIAGGIGNMIDRVLVGYVVDFIDVSPLFPFAVFNVADCCVCVGAVLLAVFVVFFYKGNESDTEQTSSAKNK